MRFLSPQKAKGFFLFFSIDNFCTVVFSIRTDFPCVYPSFLPLEQFVCSSKLFLFLFWCYFLVWNGFVSQVCFCNIICTLMCQWGALSLYVSCSRSVKQTQTQSKRNSYRYIWNKQNYMQLSWCDGGRARSYMQNVNNNNNSWLRIHEAYV